MHLFGPQQLVPRFDTPDEILVQRQVQLTVHQGLAKHVALLHHNSHIQLAVLPGKLAEQVRQLGHRHLFGGAQADGTL